MCLKLFCLDFEDKHWNNCWSFALKYKKYNECVWLRGFISILYSKRFTRLLPYLVGYLYSSLTWMTLQIVSLCGVKYQSVIAFFRTWGYHESKETVCENGAQPLNVITWSDRSGSLSAHITAISIVGGRQGKKHPPLASDSFEYLLQIRWDVGVCFHYAAHQEDSHNRDRAKKKKKNLIILEG